MSRLNHKKIDKIYTTLLKNYNFLAMSECSDNDYLILIKEFIAEYKKLKTDKKYINLSEYLWCLPRLVVFKFDLEQKNFKHACYDLMAFIRDNKETILQKRIFNNIISVNLNKI